MPKKIVIFSVPGIFSGSGGPRQVLKMNRKRLGMMALCLLLAVGGAAGALLWALTRVPEFYVQALSVEVDPAIRKQSAEEFEANTIQLVQDIEHEPEWSEEFTQD